MTYHKIVKYLMERGLSEGQTAHVRTMIRQLVNDPPKKREKCSGEGYCFKHNVVHYEY